LAVMIPGPMMERNIKIDRHMPGRRIESLSRVSCTVVAMALKNKKAAELPRTQRS
jgi:hypothetical protein